ncbi:L,D-transpeptidase family protein [Anaerobacillus arseniciselenatis]|nr:L,D-transpeptidase family protein [Anaerobacillus arseniciselenatis]
MSNQSNEHHDLKPRSKRHKTTNKVVVVGIIIFSMAIVFSLGLVSAMVMPTSSSELKEQIPMKTETKGVTVQELSIQDEQQIDVTKVSSGTNEAHDEETYDEVKDAEREFSEESEEDIGEERKERDKNTKQAEREKEVQGNAPTTEREGKQEQPREKNSVVNNSTEDPPTSNVPLEEEKLISEKNQANSNDNTKVVIVHEVQPQETLYSITMKYYINSDYQKKLAEYNNIKDPSTDIKAGMKLKIPDPLMRYHEIKRGETLFRITNTYYPSANYQELLALYNGIKDPSTDMKAGMVLKIPELSILEAQSSKGYEVKVDKSKNILTVYYNSKVVRKFSVGTGKDQSLTPEGSFKIVNKVEKPWYNPENIRGGAPENPLGSHWLGLNVPGTNGFIYGIHGTNNPSSIGNYVSLGCIRMHNADVKWLYDTLPLQTPVHIFSS